MKPIKLFINAMCGHIILYKNFHKRMEIDILKVDKSISDFVSYIPISNVVKKLTSWRNQGAEILYLISHLTLEDIKKDEIVLKKYNFPEGVIFYRKEKDPFFI